MAATNTKMCESALNYKLKKRETETELYYTQTETIISFHLQAECSINETLQMRANDVRAKNTSGKKKC